ncbi:MAG: hypothetical protein ABSG63_02450 [Spirochaetia bacterium]|jgi:hypothetical protein
MTLPRFLPDLGSWHEWHAKKGTLPDQWKGMSLSEVCRDLDVPLWRSVRPWRALLPGINVHDQRGATERTLAWETPEGTLTSRWTIGPDGDWWRSEYPVKGPADLKAALAVARARRYILSPALVQEVSSGELPALELPYRPWSELFHAFLGWSDGLMLFMEEPNAIQEIASVLEETLAPLVGEIAALPGSVVLSPDNLDGQFITLETFQERLAPSYQATADTLHAQGKLLVVHVGGPVRRLLPGLAACGIDCIQGICGPPQGDSTLSDARSQSGTHIVLWGGIAQDFLLADHPKSEFEIAAGAAFADAVRDPQAIVGVADKVPVGAVPLRLAELARMAAEHFT